ncbi:calcium/sodium antiporter [Nocardioides aequoreus]|uniref:calcium/sodium antiporter n=1 Tax=Nocardioides aequoreus TaxID=397278 RepID=UPI0004C3C4EC|nr:calcium/sodium antiporter [Nocardioides aequoreus]
MLSLLTAVAGLALLLGGAEVLVRSGTRVATRLGIPPMVIGLTVVSVGTSLPELAIGVDAARSGSPGLATGNIVGTNLVNLLVVLGVGAVLRPVLFDRRTLRFDLPCMVAAALLLWVLARDGVLTTGEGMLMVAAAAGYTVAVVVLARRAPSTTTVGLPEASLPEAPGRAARLDPLLLLGSIAVIVLGAELLVEGAVGGARAVGVSEAVIGLTVVALGTSAPELVTTVVSTLRGNAEMAVGNVIGSSVYNIALVLGVTVLAVPGGLVVPDEVLDADLVLMVGATLVALPLFLTGSRLSRLEGGLMLAAYAGYLTWLLSTRL